jgi:hypothetical protein
MSSPTQPVPPAPLSGDVLCGGCGCPGPCIAHSERNEWPPTKDEIVDSICRAVNEHRYYDLGESDYHELVDAIADRDKRLADVVALTKVGIVWFTPDAVLRAAEGRTP